MKHQKLVKYKLQASFGVIWLNNGKKAKLFDLSHFGVLTILDFMISQIDFTKITQCLIMKLIQVARDSDRVLNQEFDFW